jgi:hypothetical protein
MQYKSDSQNILKSFINFVYTQFQAIVKAIRVDNGSEFMSMRDFFPIPRYRTSMNLCLHSTTKWSCRTQTSSYSNRGTSIIISITPTP